MLKMGLPIGAVKNALLRDGKDMSIMDLDPEKSLSFQLARKGTGGGNRPVARKKVKKRVRRKKIYWTPIDPKKVVEGSLWDIVKGEFDMEKLSYDQVEFETLFTESTNPADKTKKEAKASTSKKKEAVQLIDGKRSMNGGIILARLKMTFSQIADMVNIM
jgi:Formin Homology 2 Domain